MGMVQIQSSSDEILVKKVVNKPMMNMLMHDHEEGIDTCARMDEQIDGNIQTIFSYQQKDEAKAIVANETRHSSNAGIVENIEKDNKNNATMFDTVAESNS